MTQMTKDEMITELMGMFDFDLTEAEAEQILDALQNNGEIDDPLYESIFHYYCSNGDMPYGTASAKDGDPIEWIYSTIASELGLPA